MASTFEWGMDSGTAISSPAKGTTRTVPSTIDAWKSIDDPSTAHASAPVSRGENSFERFTFAKFSGSWTSVAALKWAHTSGALPVGTTIKGIVTNTYVTPSETANVALTTDMSTPIAISSGAAVLVCNAGPEENATATASKLSSTANPAYSQYLVTQLQTTDSAEAGTLGAMEFTLSYDEQ